jgi:hypothetical protein
MDFEAVGIVVVALLTMAGSVAAETRTPERPALSVRTYNTYGVSTEHLQAARDHASAIFADAGIDISWMACGYTTIEAEGSSPACRQPLAANERILRIQATGPSEGARYVSMGFSWLSGKPDGDTPVLATVFADRAVSVARNARVDAGRVLGYAIAHEIGHLLLNDPHHSNAGLMRAIWSQMELRQNRTADWRFLSDEAAAMRHACTVVRP